MEGRENNTIRISTFIVIVTIGVIATLVNYTIIISIGYWDNNLK